MYVKLPLFTNSICENALSGIVNGKKNALAEIYDCLGRQMYSLAYAILLNHYDAEDVLQETLYEIVRCANTYEKGTNARAWILAITRNLALNTVRSNKRATPTEVFDKEFQQDFTSVFVNEALNTLSDDQHQIVILKIVGGYKHKEIAQLLDISVSNSEKKYQRARKKLKEYYKKEDMK